MKQKKFTIPLYEYVVTYVQIENTSDAPKLEEVLKEYYKTNCLDKSDQDLVDSVGRGWKDGGNYYWNTNFKKSLVLIFEYSSEEVRQRVIAHEKRHLEDKVLEWSAVKDPESAALLAGYLQNVLFEPWK